MAAVALGLLAGCERQEIRSYRIAKEAASTPPPASTAPGAKAPRPTWTTPPDWTELPPTAMRAGHFTIAGPSNQQAQVTVIPLAGQSGGDLDNVNRWRAQVGLPPLAETDVRNLAESVPIAATPGRLFDIAGTPPGQEQPARLLAAVLDRHGTAWFFKMMGNAPLVAAQKPAFIEFLRSVRFEPAE